jgi:hypothetical protein
VRRLLKLLLIVALLLAHVPVCKATATESRTFSTTPQHVSQCCAKCSKKAPAAPKPIKPVSPKPCPPNCGCLLCSAPAAVVPPAPATTDFNSPSTELVGTTAPLAAPDGFRTLLDRPPRA